MASPDDNYNNGLAIILGLTALAIIVWIWVQSSNLQFEIIATIVVIGTAFAALLKAAR